jgi:transcriptional repressor NrdR
VETLDRLIDQFEREMQEWGDREVSSDTIGRWFIDKLRSTDEVAYVRFASVFRSFNDLEEFLAELEGLRMERQQRVSRGSW